MKVKKKKGRRSEIVTPDSDAETKVVVQRRHTVLQSNVSAGEVKAVLQDTVWRVQNEIFPGIDGLKDARLQSDENAYVLMLSMMLGWPEQKPRQGFQIRNHEYTSSELPMHRRCK